MESIQHKAWVAYARATKGTQKTKIYQYLRLDSLHDQRWCRKLCLFNKVLESENTK